MAKQETHSGLVQITENTLIKFMDETSKSLQELRTDVGMLIHWKDTYEDAGKKINRLWFVIGAMSTVIITLLGFLISLLTK